MTVVDWNPEQYRKFAAVDSRPRSRAGGMVGGLVTWRSACCSSARECVHALASRGRRAGPHAFEEFVVDYEAALIAAVGDRSPFFFPFRRILMWARRSS